MNSSIELIRLIAVILITFTHTKNDLDSGVLYYIIEILPTYGTAILSIISGYLYYTVSRNKENLFYKKVKSLAVPYLIANISVLLMVLAANFVIGYNPLSRFSYDYKLITEGIFALNHPPINPPTYFVRDIFVVFSIIALLTQKTIRTLFVIIPILFFGTLFLNHHVVILFIIGCAYALIKDKIKKKYIIIAATSIVLIIVSIYFVDYLKYPVSFLFFVLLIDLKFKFFKTGRFSYLLHLYHSPIMIITYPLISRHIHNTMLNIFLQIFISIVMVFALFLVSKKFKKLEILSGGR